MDSTSGCNQESLLALALARFDHLVAQDELFFEPSRPEKVRDRGFEFEVRIIPAFLRKPILSALDPGRKKAGGPLSDPEPEFVVEEVTESHLLQLNKYCVYQPQFILHPKKFAKQTDDLDINDFAAIWATLDQLGKPYVVFYNCGVDAGSSQGHKHMQLIPKPPLDEFILFPDEPEMRSVLQSSTGAPMRPPDSLNVPYACRLMQIPPNTSPETVMACYTELMEWLHKHQHVISPDCAYNMVMTRDWICIIPRRHADIQGIPANAMSMMGLVWVKEQEERDGWERLGWASHLLQHGIPPA